MFSTLRSHSAQLDAAMAEIRQAEAAWHDVWQTGKACALGQNAELSIEVFFQFQVLVEDFLEFWYRLRTQLAKRLIRSGI